jgi:hypothetical protein
MLRLFEKIIEIFEYLLRPVLKVIIKGLKAIDFWLQEFFNNLY